MNKEQYWNSLTEEQQKAITEAMDKAEGLGLDIVIVDAIDLWYLLPQDNRGYPPEYED